MKDQSIECHITGEPMARNGKEAPGTGPVDAAFGSACSTLVDVLRRRASENGTKTAYTFLQDGETVSEELTYAELDKRARSVAAFLQKKVGAGQRLLLLLPPSLDYVVAFFGCLYAGVCAVPAYPLRNNSNAKGLTRLKGIAADCRPAAALILPEWRKVASRLARTAAELADICWITIDSFDRNDADKWRSPELQSSDEAFLQYTSGSTGSPKGAIITHANILHNQQLMKDAFRHDESTVIVGWLPMFHDMGLVGNVLHPVFIGARSVLMPPMAFLQKPVRWLRAIGQFKATTSGGPNFAYDLCVRKISVEEQNGLDLSSWKVAFNGAEPVRAHALDAFVRTFSSNGFRRESFYPCYGLAEATLMVSGGEREVPPVIKHFRRDALELGTAILPQREEHTPITELVGCGRSLGGQTLVIVNPGTQALCKNNEVGEIWVSGPSIAKGYWDDARTTQSVFGATLSEYPGQKFLRTGDLGFRFQGELFVCGRIKDQIIIRGRNYHPHDLELVAESSHEAFRAGCSAAFPIEVDGQEQVVIVAEVRRAHRKVNVGELASVVRLALAEEYQIQVHTVALIREGSLPKTSSGKIQRHAAKNRFLNGSLELIGSSAPAHEDEDSQNRGPDSDFSAFLSLAAPEREKAILDYLRSELARLLRVPVSLIIPERSLADLGIDSLALAEVHHRLEYDLNVHIPLAELLEYPSINRLAAHVVERMAWDESPAGPPLLHVNRSWHSQPLSYGQQALYFLSELNPENSAYNISRAVELLEEVEPAALRRSLHKLVDRHPALKVTFGHNSAEPFQIFNESLRVDLRQEDVSFLDREAVAEKLKAEKEAPFDLKQGPLLRVCLFHTQDRRILQLTIHHLVADLWSLVVLCRELAQIYGAETSGQPAELPVLPVNYSDYVDWQYELLRSGEGQRQASYWEKCLDGELPVLALPASRIRPAVQTYNGSSCPVELSAEAVNGLRKLCVEQSASLYAGVLTAFHALLHRLTGQNDIVIGSPFFGRNRAELADIVGYFVNLLPFRQQFDGEISFRKLLEQQRQLILDAFRNSEFPFSLMVAKKGKRNASYSPIFQAMLVMERLPVGLEDMAPLAVNMAGFESRLDPLRMRSISLPVSASQFDLSLIVTELPDGRMAGLLEYNTDLFDQEQISRIAGYFERLVQSALSSPDEPIGSLPMLSENERWQLVEDWNSTAKEYPAGICLHELFESQVRRTPEQTAVEYGDQSLSFRELNCQANRLARRLDAIGIGPETIVGISCERSLEMVIGLLAILKTGAAYMPIDRDYPHELIEYMAQDAAIRVLLTSGDDFPLNSSHGIVVVDMKQELVKLSAEDFTDLPVNNGHPDNLAYVIYTSGSTGKPKGVMVPHKGICNRLLWMDDAYRLAPCDKVLQKTPLSFDVSVWEVFWPLIAGATLVVAPPGHHKDPERLARLISCHGITVLHFVPSMLRIFLDEEGLGESCSNLRLVICSGEALTSDVVRMFYSKISASLQNLYGPTEASVDVTSWACDAGTRNGSVPIGRPIANTQIYVLNSSLEAVPPGVPGHLHIAGVGIARGYLRRPQQTAANFLPNPFSTTPGERLYRSGDLARYRADGVIEFLGRVDSQVKVNGNRIELAGVEATLAQHPSVKEAAVLAHGNQLTAYVVLHPEANADMAPVRHFSEQKMPSFMVPSVWIALEQLPLTASGKLDRKSLPTPGPQRARSTVYVPPVTPEQEILCAIWEKALKTNQIGIRDNFFEVGGDSMRCIQVVSLARQNGLHFDLEKLYQCQTIEELTRDLVPSIVISGRNPGSIPFGLVPAEDREKIPHGLENACPMSVLQQGLLFHSERDEDYEIYVTSLKVRAPFCAEYIEQAFQRSVARHQILRTTFDTASFSVPMQLVHPRGKAAIEVHDFRAFEEAQAKEEFALWLNREKKRRFDWAQCPVVRISVHQLKDEYFWITLSDPLLDGWSVATLLTELLSDYNRLLQGMILASPQSPASSFAHFVALEKNALESEECAQYWNTVLAGCTPHRIHKGCDAAVSADMVRRVQMVVPPATAQGLRDLARQVGVSLKEVFLAAQLKVLGIFSSSSDVITGLIWNGRPMEEDGENVIGTHLNALPFRFDLSGSCSWKALVRKVFDRQRELLRYRWYPVAEVQRQRGRQALFDAVFNFTYFHVYQQIGELSGMVIEEAYASEQTYYPLTTQCHINHQTSEFLVALDYTPEFSSDQVQGICNCFLQVLLEMAEFPEAPHDLFSSMSPDQRQQVLVDWNKTDLHSSDSRSLVERIEHWAQHHPASIAAVCNGIQLTYGELNERSNRLANYLRSRGAGINDRVAICVDRSLNMIVGTLGAIKTGAAYVPIDPAYPSARIAAILEDVQARFILTEQKARQQLSPGSAEVIELDANMPEIVASGSQNCGIRPGPDDLAYVIFTSGSTGRPKGVEIPHHGLENLVNWHLHEYQLSPRDRMTQLAGFGFDASVWEIWPVLAAGASIFIADDETRLSSAKLKQWLLENQITISFIPTPIFEGLQQLDFPDEIALKTVLIGGDKLKLCLQRKLPFRVINHYGPTENTVVATFGEVPFRPGSKEAPHIGKPISNAQVFILDQRGQPTPPGVPGELCLGGESLARGYFNSPDLTSEKFVIVSLVPGKTQRIYRTGDLAAYLPDGNIQFLGRMDHQVKIRGVRIETAEIEALLLQNDQVKEAAVLALPDANQDSQLVAFVTAACNETYDVAKVYRFLRSKLPEFMVPSAIMLLDSLPLSPNGKLDRNALPRLDAVKLSQDREFIPPQNDIEKNIAEIWQSVLQRGPVGAQHNFFELGGHSLLATQIVSRLRRKFEIEMPLSIIFENPTVRELSSKIHEMKLLRQGEQDLTSLLDQIDQLSDEEVMSRLEITNFGQQMEHDARADA